MELLDDLKGGLFRACTIPTWNLWVEMISFDLRCANGHTFEGWFKDGASFEEQKKRNLIACPICNNKDIEKVPTTFGILSKSSGSREEWATEVQANFFRQFVAFVEKNFEDVGPRFASEALKMHYGVTEKRNIRGSSTEEEEKMLKKEGIKFYKIPIPRFDSCDS